jgi:hemolysin III
MNMEPTTTSPGRHLETRAEEWASSITHAIGLGLAVAGFYILIGLCAAKGDVRRTVTLSLYGASLILLYLASTCFHACHPAKYQRAKHWLKIMDHVAIYALISGTYTPFLLVLVRGAWGWSLFAALWGLTAIGTFLKLFYVHRFERLSTSVYVLMGWLGCIAARPFLATVPLPAIGWLAAGGLLYTGGVIFFFWDRLPYNHAIWHLFVMAGSVCHFIAMLRYIAPVA